MESLFIGFRVLGCRAYRASWTPKVCKIMAFMATTMGLGLLLYILLGFREGLRSTQTPKVCKIIALNP